VIEEVARLLELLDSSLAVILLTGRPGRVRPQTLAWLERTGCGGTCWSCATAALRLRDRLQQGVVEDLRRHGFDLRLALETILQPRQYVAEGVPCVYIHSGYYE